MEQSSVDTSNQQERFLNLAWLAGLFEGEGSISLVKGSANRIMPRVHFINSDMQLVEEWANGWKNLGVGNYVQTRKVYNPEKHKQTKQVLICGLKRVHNFINILLPYIRGHKKEVAQTVLDYLEYRLSLPNGGKRQGYTSKDYDYLVKVRGLNQKGPGKSSETIRCRLGLSDFGQSQDIVQA
jgi:hypothetical protein